MLRPSITQWDCCNLVFCSLLHYILNGLICLLVLSNFFSNFAQTLFFLLFFIQTYSNVFRIRCVTLSDICARRVTESLTVICHPFDFLTSIFLLNNHYFFLNPLDIFLLVLFFSTCKDLRLIYLIYLCSCLLLLILSAT